MGIMAIETKAFKTISPYFDSWLHANMSINDIARASKHAKETVGIVFTDMIKQREKSRNPKNDGWEDMMLGKGSQRTEWIGENFYFIYESKINNEK